MNWVYQNNHRLLSIVSRPRYIDRHYAIVWSCREMKIASFFFNALPTQMPADYYSLSDGTYTKMSGSYRYVHILTQVLNPVAIQ